MSSQSGGEPRESGDLEQGVVELEHDLEHTSDVLKHQLEDVIALEMDRTKELDSLAMASIDLQKGADTFQKSAHTLKEKKWWEMIRAKLMWGLLVLFLVVLLTMIIRNSFLGGSQGEVAVAAPDEATPHRNVVPVPELPTAAGAAPPPSNDA